MTNNGSNKQAVSYARRAGKRRVLTNKSKRAVAVLLAMLMLTATALTVGIKMNLGKANAAEDICKWECEQCVVPFRTADFIFDDYNDYEKTQAPARDRSIFGGIIREKDAEKRYILPAALPANLEKDEVGYLGIQNLMFENLFVEQETVTQEKFTKEETTIKVNAKSGLLMDYHTGEVVFEQNADARMPIASMVKIMTLSLVFEEIEKGNLSLETDVVASSNATAMGGSQAFLDTGASYKAGELIKTIVVSSANDSCMALAEHIAGSSDDFVSRMNDRAMALGMKDTNFANCTGLPSPNGYSSARDVATMTREMLKYQNFFLYSREWLFNFQHPCGRVTELSNTNKLVRFYEGCDGGKTGFTNEAMYCLSATAKRGATRLISVVMGANTSKERNTENSKLFNFGFANYETRQLVISGTVLEEQVKVEKGKQDFITVKTDGDLFFFSKRGKREVGVEVIVDKVNAPVSVGQKVGEMIVSLDGTEAGRVGLVSEVSVDKKGYLDFVNDMIRAF
ncbi:MAG: D-alanyl-D-alanine carboxypeptidase [Firmicutes bacterium]|nr:D-alanyl-D-alanine carboxypeptidase [Bacillota bacterium]